MIFANDFHKLDFPSRPEVCCCSFALRAAGGNDKKKKRNVHRSFAAFFKF